jgi:hypothetical protein
MKGKVTSLISASESSDGQRRVEILLEGCDALFRKLRVPEKLLGGVALGLDDELIMTVAQLPRAEELAAAHDREILLNVRQGEKEGEKK